MPGHTGHSPCAPPEVTVLLSSELLLGAMLQVPEGVVRGTSSDRRVFQSPVQGCTQIHLPVWPNSSDTFLAPAWMGHQGSESLYHRLISPLPTGFTWVLLDRTM